MIFLIDFDRRNADLRVLEAYPEGDRSIAAARRLEIELAMDWETAPREVVIIEAEDEAALRRGYGRYFESEGLTDETYEEALRRALTDFSYARFTGGSRAPAAPPLTAVREPPEPGYGESGGPGEDTSAP